MIIIINTLQDKGCDWCSCPHTHDCLWQEMTIRCSHGRHEDVLVYDKWLTHLNCVKCQASVWKRIKPMVVDKVLKYNYQFQFFDKELHEWLDIGKRDFFENVKKIYDEYRADISGADKNRFRIVEVTEREVVL